MNKVLSLGLGVQSTALYFMSSLGELPRVDVAIFADLGREKRKTYEYLDYLLKWKEQNDGIEIIVVKKKNLFQHLLETVNSSGNRFAAIPAFTKNDDGTIGMLKRQCTGEYKISELTVNWFITTFREILIHEKYAKNNKTCNE